ncbi:hypothetical protein FPZ47_09210 [Mycobacterium helveticum]|uniref:Uncharacterized protein n=1 Tax=Mycobacterium helveticum TaxID=2592811 RepID=A0A557XWP9_9MYCO|nr:hypothetical protein FPZ46_06610 [Mycobacterium helveticum]TVS90509.1 hypothetical protein FPZ47_09210 [Mycobacterium helveticum]
MWVGVFSVYETPSILGDTPRRPRPRRAGEPDQPGVINPGVISPGLISPGLISPGLINPV